MGAAAFVMAEFLAVPYAQVALWAAIPAVMYYGSVFFAVHFESRRFNLRGVPRDELPRLGHVLLTRGHLFIPILIILFGLFLGYSAPLSALVAALMCLPVALARASTRAGIRWRTVLQALEEGARNALAVAMACACAGLVIGSVTITGLGIVFTQVVLDLAQNTLFLALLLTAIAGIVLGMGMPTTPAYIVMVALLVPALIKLGVVTPAAHMFAIYFAILSAITPPVALAVFAAAGLAKANVWQAGFAAMRAGAPAYIVPFMFVYEPSLLLILDDGTRWYMALWSIATAFLGVIALAGGLFGWFLGYATALHRALLLGAALCLIKPGMMTDTIGFSLIACVLLLQWRSQPAIVVPATETGR
ncbi:MAG: TRAP transporter fused permease subunit, partial [Hylemonella sp.]|nr:TRAP transporter fused permease subunit [Hylemonella sp.]